MRYCTRKYVWLGLICCGLLPLLSGRGAPAQPEAMLRLDAGNWLKVQADESTETLAREARAPGVKAGGNGGDWARMPVTFPGNNVFRMPLSEPLSHWQDLNVELVLPTGFPENATIYFFVRDWDYYWFQVYHRIPQVRDEPARFRLPLQGTAAAKQWQPVGHKRVWHSQLPGRIREFGIKFDFDQSETVAPFTGALYVSRPWVSGKLSATAVFGVREFGFAPAMPCVGEMVEFSFALTGLYASPFDLRQFAVEAAVVNPAGDTVQVPGFYIEDFVYRPAEVKGGLMPYGEPGFRVRYTPRHKGKHTVTITIKHGEQSQNLPSTSLTVSAAAPDYQGFIRLDANHPLFLEFESGKPLHGIGINARATYDTRYQDMMPFSLWQDEGLEQYRRLFETYAANGINVVEVWLCSWWLALEWINDAPGNHGVGHINQHRAWLLDQLMQMAEQHGIYVMLVLNNHGKFSQWCDAEWDRNPYNKANGGYLGSASEYFSSPRAAQDFKNFAGYVVARWGYSPHILAWKLFSEINLTGDSPGFYQQPPMANWHREMAEFLKKTDPHQHLVTTHWSTNYTLINDAVGEIKALDFLTTDAYGGSNANIFQLFHSTAQYSRQKNKSVLITEYGGSPMGDSIGNLIKQLHLANWKGWFSQMSIVPMIWWFAMIDEKNLYSEYQALHNFIRNEDSRTMKSNVSFYLPNTTVGVEMLQNPQRTLLWGFDRKFYFANTENAEPELFKNVHLPVKGLLPGQYQVEYWDCQKGVVTSREKIKIESDSANLSLPPFRRDFAAKLIRLQPGAAK